jgi:hypothetical protein
MAGVSEVEEEDSLDEKLFVDLLVVIVRVTELVRTMSLSRIMDVGLSFVVIKLGQGWLYLLVKGCLQVVGQRLVPG